MRLTFNLEVTVPMERLPTVSSPNSRQTWANARRLSDVALREEVELTWIDLPAEQAEPLLERGLLPGCRLCPIRTSPSGDPIVMVDGSLIALRRETARCLCVSRAAGDATEAK